MTIRLLIVDDHDWVREGLRLVIEPTEIDVIDEGTSYEEAVFRSIPCGDRSSSLKNEA